MCRLPTIIVVVVALGWLSTTDAYDHIPKPSFGSQNAYLPPPPQNRPLDLLDKLYNKLDDYKCMLKTVKEQLDALESALGQLKETARKIKLLTVPRLDDVDLKQMELMNDIASHIERANSSLDQLCDCVVNVTRLDDANLVNITSLRIQSGGLFVAQIRQLGRLTFLQGSVNDLRQKLLQVFGNEFELLKDQIADVSGAVATTQAREEQVHCETGVLDLERDDRRGEYLYQNSYPSTPHVTYTLSSYKFLLDTRPTPPPSFGNYFPWEEPNQIGVFVAAIPSRTGVTFEKFNLAYGDTANQKVSVSFLACTVGAGTQSKH